MQNTAPVASPRDQVTRAIWHSIPVDEVVASLDTDAEGGLSPDEAARRLSEYGPNRILERERDSDLRIVLRQFSSVLVWILIGAAVVAGLVLGDAVESIAIVAIVVINAAIGFVQERRAADALASLRDLSAPTARVIRGGRRAEIPAAEVVPGDLVLLDAGDRVPADARVLESVRLQTDESPLTGESLPVSKTVDPFPEETLVADRRCMVHAGTTVAAGRGSVVTTATAGETEMGRIAGLLGEKEPETPLERDLARTGRRLAVLAGMAAVVVFVVGLAKGGSIESLVLVAVALAVAAIPEGLPAVTTITLARGVRAMAERNAVVRRLPAVEALGASQVICTDKTGTLTRNRMQVTDVRVNGPGGGDGAVLERFARVLGLCSDVETVDGAWSGDPTEVALIEAVDPVVLELSRLRRDAPRLDEIGFDSDRKRMVTLHRIDGRYLLAVKGAPEVIVDLATGQATPSGDVVLESSERERLRGEAVELAERGLRTIAAGEAWFDRRPTDLEAAERELVYLGIAGMADEVRVEAAPSVARCGTAGVTVVMVTGDHKVTARTVAREIGLLDNRDVIDHRSLAEMDDLQLVEVVDGVGVYARVEPADKVRIVQAWQARGKIVAMTGDGVNDAPALRMADIGVAMGTGTDVAKDASDIVLADDNFASIVAAVEHGRSIFANLRRVVYFLLAANLSEIVVMVTGFLLFAASGEPLLAVQLLWVNLITDGLPALALGVDPPAEGIMERPPDSDRNMLSLAHQGRLVWQGAVLAIGPLSLFWFGDQVAGLEWEATRTLGFTGLVMVQLVHALTVRAQTHGLFQTPVRNKALMAALVGSALLHVVAIVTPFGEVVLGTSPFPPEYGFVVLMAAIVPALIIDRIKVIARRARPDASVVWD